MRSSPKADQGPHLLAAEEAVDVARLLEQQVGMAAEDGAVALAGAGERHAYHLDALAGEEVQRDVVGAAEAEDGHLERARLGLGLGHHVVPGLEAAVGLDEEPRRLAYGDRQRGHVGQLPARAAGDQGGGGVADQDGHRIAVGLPAEQLGHAGIAGGAGHVDHREGGLQVGFEQLAQLACELVGATARAPGHDEFDRSLRILLLADGGRGREQRGQGKQDLAEQLPGRELHGGLLLSVFWDGAPRWPSGGPGNGMARFALREYTPLPRAFAIVFAINENFHSIF
jgi:hypothetical protein